MGNIIKTEPFNEMRMNKAFIKDIHANTNKYQKKFKILLCIKF